MADIHLQGTADGPFQGVGHVTVVTYQVEVGCTCVYYIKGPFRHTLGYHGGGSCLQHLQGLKIGTYEVQGYRICKRQGEGVESSQVTPVIAGRLPQ